MQTPGGIHDQHIGIAFFGGGDGVKDHGGRVCALSLFNELHAHPIGPNLELIDRTGTEGVGGG